MLFFKILKKESKNQLHLIGLINFKYYQLNFYSASKFSSFVSPWSPDSPFYRLFREWDDKGVVERCAFLGHHITAMVSFMWILETNQLLYFANHRLMAEWSTPLLNAVLLSDHFPNLPFIVKDILKGMDVFSRYPLIHRNRIPTVKLKIPGKLFLKSNPEILLHSSYSF